MTEYYHARLIALENWSTVQSALTTQGDRLTILADTLDISELGAYSVLAMTDRPPSRGSVEAHLRHLEHLKHRLDGAR